MRASRLSTAVSVLAVAASACGTPGSAPPPATVGRPVSFAAFGDTPYSRAEVQAVPRLIAQVNRAGVDFSVFLGDLKGGGRCEDAHYAAAVGQFNAFFAPLVYTPGDNEWTDCHAAGQDPLERLDRIRRTMFASSRSFGRRTLDLDQQRPDYPENARWRIGAVQFATVHVTGSNNNHVADPDAGEEGTPRTADDRRAAAAEHRARDGAGRAWVRETFARAREARSGMVVLFMQADPWFDVPADQRAGRRVDGFDAMIDTLRRETASFGRPVVLVHGDSHRYQVDRPLGPGTRLTRIGTYGSPDVGWVAVTVDPSGPEPVRVVPHLVARSP